jgi:hypothetical protein
MTAGILRVPQSDLIAVAWPFANVPTGITVTVEGGRPVFSRSAIDALGISKMLGKKTTIEAEPRDGGPKLRIVVDGDKLVSAEPAGATVVRGVGCDNMAFFSSPEAAERWKKQRHEDGATLSLAEAVQRGARIFGRFTESM